MDIQEYLMMEYLNDQQLVAHAQKLLASTTEGGSPLVPVPVNLLKALIEKAQRPHD